ncbi:hypothetical protein [Acidovorax sp.]|uniref:hypothetical protein n=1 Tax=Acidovorax sp. TaxID=1872122 RepID=UPI002601804F|nr:hypothetical protein [Acidovorax sp.]
MRLRYFLDWGGDILWAGDDEANEKYGYPTDLDLLPISHETRELIKILFCIWPSIAQGSKSKSEKEEFDKLNKEVFARLVSELQTIEISNEMPNISSQPTAHGGG